MVEGKAPWLFFQPLTLPHILAIQESGCDREPSLLTCEAWKPVGCEFLMTGAAGLDHLAEGRMDLHLVVALGRRGQLRCGLMEEAVQVDERGRQDCHQVLPVLVCHRLLHDEAAFDRPSLIADRSAISHDQCVDDVMACIEDGYHLPLEKAL